MTLDLVALGADTMTEAELLGLAENLRQLARDAEELRLLKLQRGETANRPAPRAVTPTRPATSAAIDPIALMKERHRHDPARLVEVVREVRLFTDDLGAIVSTAVSWAEDCGLDSSSYVPIITEAVRSLPRPGARNAG